MKYKLTYCIVVSILITLQPLYAAQPEYLNSSASDFAHPHDLALDPDGNYLLVSDMRNDVVRVLDPATLETVNRIGQGQLSLPHDLTFNANGQLLIADSGNDRIAIFNYDDGHATLQSSIRQGLRSPEGVTIDNQGQIHVASTGNNHIVVFKNAKLIMKGGGYGGSQGKFIRPHDIEAGPDGFIYVGDPGNNRIQVLDTDLEPREIIKGQNPIFNEPKYLALSDQGILFVADQYNNMLRIFDKDRNEIMTLKQAGGSNLSKIEGVEYVNGTLWVADTYNNRIVSFRWLP